MEGRHAIQHDPGPNQRKSIVAFLPERWTPPAFTAALLASLPMPERVGVISNDDTAAHLLTLLVRIAEVVVERADLPITDYDRETLRQLIRTVREAEAKQGV